MADNRILHRKHLSKPNSELTQKPNNRGTGLRGPNRRFIKSHRTINIQDSDSDLGDTAGDSNHQHARLANPRPPHKIAARWEEDARN